MQARDGAHELRGESFAAAYTSPLRRALETARILGQELGLGFTVDEGLKEVDVGSWSGLTRTEAEARFPAGYTRWLEYGHGWDDGETYDALGDRVVRSLLRLANRHADAAAFDPRDRQLRPLPPRGARRETRARRLNGGLKSRRRRADVRSTRAQVFSTPARPSKT
jgi:histidine phosphatase superfamily protein (branch 1)